MTGRIAFTTLLTVAVVLLSHVSKCSAFAPAAVPPLSRHHFPPVHLSSADNDNGAFSATNGGGGSKWKLANDFPQFLNQCAIQSFLTVLRSLRDPQTIRWVDNFTQPVFDSQKRTSVRLTGTTDATHAITEDQNVANPNGESYSKLLTYHGLAVMNTTKFPTWDSYFATLLEKPVDAFIIQSFNGLTADYEIEINPPSVCSRIISVREQIARELANDLGILANMGYHTMDSYWEYLDNQREEDNNDNKGGMMGEEKRDEVTMSSGAGRRRLAPQNLCFLEYNIDDPFGDTQSSSLRKGNFDLVVLLATQESIHRILNNEQNANIVMGDDFPVYQKYLVDFYGQRFLSHFSGIQRYNRADDFLEELLFSSPRMSTSDGGSALVDPVQLTEMILSERRQVSLEWQALSKDVPNDHIGIKRLQLNRLMQSYNTESKTD